MPEKSFIITDLSIIDDCYWSEDAEKYNNVERLRLFLAWRNSNSYALILKKDWKQFKDKLKEKSTDDTKKKLIHEMEETTKSFVITQKYFDEDEGSSSRHNLIILAKILNRLGEVCIVTNTHCDKKFEEEIGGANVYTLEQFNDFVNRECNGFFDYIHKEFYESSA